ncbi:hypothetical protein QJS04_geneDACA008306 [Acorus gramineus]|uniref:Secreted protein n=1 Tax=Acorus gramineus TaxID=55184 RepID=A0AAV9AYC2_ACOGR|nr:hypothetical protein QJS04_geneDACA008306 [Acorus gramineus]
MSCCVDSLMPLHSVTASVLMTSMLSVARPGRGWLSEEKFGEESQATQVLNAYVGTRVVAVKKSMVARELSCPKLQSDRWIGFFRHGLDQ